jgi:hypothetical protein
MKLLVLEEVVAIMQAVNIDPAAVARFRQHVDLVLGKRPALMVDNVTVTSGYGSKSGQGFVELTINQERTQMDVNKAREVAGMLLEATSAAAGDAALVQLLREKLGITDPDKIGMVLLDLRELRQGTRGIARPQ